MRRATRTDHDVPAMEAIAAYREFGTTLEELAFTAKQDNKPLTARSRARRALIAFRAERAEMIDPEPRAFRVCHCVDCLLFREYAAKEAHPLS